MNLWKVLENERPFQTFQFTPTLKITEAQTPAVFRCLRTHVPGIPGRAGGELRRLFPHFQGIGLAYFVFRKYWKNSESGLMTIMLRSSLKAWR